MEQEYNIAQCTREFKSYLKKVGNQIDHIAWLHTTTYFCGMPYGGIRRKSVIALENIWLKTYEQNLQRWAERLNHAVYMAVELWCNIMAGWTYERTICALRNYRNNRYQAQAAIINIGLEIGFSFNPTSDQSSDLITVLKYAKRHDSRLDTATLQDQLWDYLEDADDTHDERHEASYRVS